MEITIDTHALVWYLDSALSSKLSPLAFQTIEKAETKGTIFISVIVLAEMLHLSEKGRINLNFKDFYSKIKDSSAYSIYSLTPSIIEQAVKYQGLELHDRIILATAVYSNSNLISKDVKLREFSGRVIW